MVSFNNSAHYTQSKTYLRHKAAHHTQPTSELSYFCSTRKLLFIVDIEVYGSFAESDLSNAEELPLTMSDIGYFSVAITLLV